MVILGVTGSIIEFEPELDRLFHPHLSFVIPGSRTLSLSDIGDAVSQRFGGEPVVAYLPSLSPGLSYQVVLPRGIVYVNQYTGEVLGLRERGQTFLGYMRALHVRLAIGDVGRNIVRWSGAAMLFSLLSGLYLWWPIKRVRIRGDWRSRRFLFDLHNSVGIYSFLVLTLLAATGTVIGFEDQLESLIHKRESSAQLQTGHATIPEPTPGACSPAVSQTASMSWREAMLRSLKRPTISGREMGHRRGSISTHVRELSDFEYDYCCGRSVAEEVPRTCEPFLSSRLSAQICDSRLAA